MMEKQWKEYEERVVPKDAGDSQRKQTQMAFYGGGWVVIHLLMASLSDGKEPTREDVQMMAALYKELAEFPIKAMRGK